MSRDKIGVLAARQRNDLEQPSTPLATPLATPCLPVARPPARPPEPSSQMANFNSAATQPDGTFRTYNVKYFHRSCTCGFPFLHFVVREIKIAKNHHRRISARSPRPRLAESTLPGRRRAAPGGGRPKRKEMIAPLSLGGKRFFESRAAPMGWDWIFFF